MARAFLIATGVKHHQGQACNKYTRQHLGSYTLITDLAEICW